MEDIGLRNYAYLGDAVWELFVREKTAFETTDAKLLHNLTTERVNAKFQHDLFKKIEEKLTESEIDLARRARNLSIPVGRKSIQNDYRHATAFETLIGFWYLNEPTRLDYFKEILIEFI